MQAITTIGLDIAKSVFQVHGVDADSMVVIRKRVGRLASGTACRLRLCRRSHAAATLLALRNWQFRNRSRCPLWISWRSSSSSRERSQPEIHS